MSTVELDTRYLTLRELHEQLGELLKTQSPEIRTTVTDVRVRDRWGERRFIAVNADERIELSAPRYGL